MFFQLTVIIIKRLSFIITFLAFFLSQIIAQGLPSQGDINLLLVYVEINKTTSITFDKKLMPEKIKDFYKVMSNNKLNLHFSILDYNIEQADTFRNYKEALYYILQQCDNDINLSTFSRINDTTILDGICIIIDDFNPEWEENPNWSGYASIILPDDSIKFGGLEISKQTAPGYSSGLVMRAPNGFDYSFWVFAHEIGHLLGLEHMPNDNQIPYYHLMTISGDLWGVSRGMAFWERRYLNWGDQEIILDLSNYNYQQDSISFNLPDYITTGVYGKICLPQSEAFNNNVITYYNNRALYLENRQRISEYDQDKNHGSKGVFIWKDLGKLVYADEKENYDVFSTNDAFSPESKKYNRYQFVHTFNKIENITDGVSYYIQTYELTITLNFYNDRIVLSYNNLTKTKSDFHIINLKSSNKINLFRNYPNPFNMVTNISFMLSDYKHVSISIYDINGKFVKNILDKYLNSGHHQFTFNASELASGIYFCVIKTPRIQEEKSSYEMHSIKMLFLK